MCTRNCGRYYVILYFYTKFQQYFYIFNNIYFMSGKQLNVNFNLFLSLHSYVIKHDLIAKNSCCLQIMHLVAVGWLVGPKNGEILNPFKSSETNQFDL